MKLSDKDQPNDRLKYQPSVTTTNLWPFVEGNSKFLVRKNVGVLIPEYFTSLRPQPVGREEE